MKILWIITQGIGNVAETIPAYHNMEKHFGEDSIDVRYLSQYPTDNIKKTSFYPARVELITEDIVSYYISQYRKGKSEYYDWIIKLPFYIACPDSQYAQEYVDNMREMDTEVQRNLRICEFFDVDDTFSIPKKYEDTKENKTIVLHNGGLDVGMWKRKKYPAFPSLVRKLKKEYPDYRVISIGNGKEYIKGAENRTGLPLNKSIEFIKDCSLYIGTDTGTAHIAGLYKKKGIILYTLTDPRKNYDRRMHGTLKIVRRDYLECIPCQRGYHMIHTRNCEDPQCQNIPVDKIMDTIKEQKWLTEEQ